MKTVFKPLLLSVAAMGLSFGLAGCGGSDTASSGRTVTSGTANIGGAFSLIDDKGNAVTEADITGKPNLIYFGFTYCPDVCPTALQKMGAAQSMLGDRANDVGFVLISVDPERDTVESIGQYVTANGFPEGLRGFTGTLENIEAAKTAYKVYATKVDTPESAGDYTVDHSDIMYLMGADGKFVDFFYGKSTPTEIAGRVTRYLKTGR